MPGINIWLVKPVSRRTLSIDVIYSFKSWLIGWRCPASLDFIIHRFVVHILVTYKHRAVKNMLIKCKSKCLRHCQWRRHWPLGTVDGDGFRCAMSCSSTCVALPTKKNSFWPMVQSNICVEAPLLPFFFVTDILFFCSSSKLFR